MKSESYTWRDWTALGLLLLVLIVCLPIFVCMAPWVDSAFYDVCALVIQHGGVLYRDTFDTNLPGMAWLQALTPQQGVLGGASDWEDLQRIADFLRHQELPKDELICLHESTMPLYLELDRTPPLRYLFYGQAIGVYRGHRQQMLEELSVCRSRYAVSDLTMSGWRPSPTGYDTGSDGQQPPDFSKPLSEVFPWSEPIVFCSGRYAVHRVNKSIRRFWP